MKSKSSDKTIKDGNENISITYLMEDTLRLFVTSRPLGGQSHMGEMEMKIHLWNKVK
jgi:hypothetical protein